MAEEFSEAWIVDLKGDARNSGERRRREGGNVFEDKIKVGIAVAFFIRKKGKSPFKVNYLAVQDYATEDDKRSYIGSRDLSRDNFLEIRPNDRGTWLNQIQPSEWDSFLPIASKESKSTTSKGGERSIFKLYSLGVVTARDDWVYARSDDELNQRIPWFLNRYRKIQDRLAKLPSIKRWDAIGDVEIKLTRAIKNDLVAGTTLRFSSNRNRPSLYRPYTLRRLHFWRALNEMQYRLNDVHPTGSDGNLTLLISGHPNKKPFQALATPFVHSYHTLEDTEGLARYRYPKSGERIDNITDWALNKFTKQYRKKAGVTKDAIFAYCYAVLHDPVYRAKYALNLKREFPRIPFYPDFRQWAQWGETLLDLHIDYEEVEPYPLERVDTPDPRRAEGSHPKPKLKSQPENGVVVVDEDTQLTGIPAGAWDYRLGNRSAIDWVLDQHKEKKPKDPTIREKFNTYRFADYKESMITLLAKVVRVSVETNVITNAMKALDRNGWDERNDA